MIRDAYSFIPHYLRTFSTNGMLISKNRRFSLPSATLLVVVSVVLIAMTISARTWFTNPSFVEKSAFTAAQGKPTSERFEAELITLTPRGFEPAEITRPKGKFLLAVDNRSGYHEITLRLDRETGNRLHEVNQPKGRLKWRNEVDLPPGSYLLTEARNPQRSCRITITPR